MNFNFKKTNKIVTQNQTSILLYGYSYSLSGLWGLEV